MSDVTRGSLTAEQVGAYEDALTRHYGEPVRPVSAYCKALDDYAAALAESGNDGPFPPDVAEFVRTSWGVLRTYAWKSNLLARLVYLGQPLRTRKCPEHEGHWCGCKPEPCPHGCSVGYDVTGWLP